MFWFSLTNFLSLTVSAVIAQWRAFFWLRLILDEYDHVFLITDDVFNYFRLTCHRMAKNFPAFVEASFCRTHKHFNACTLSLSLQMHPLHATETLTPRISEHLVLSLNFAASAHARHTLACSWPEWRIYLYTELFLNGEVSFFSHFSWCVVVWCLWCMLPLLWLLLLLACLLLVVDTFSITGNPGIMR